MRQNEVRVKLEQDAMFIRWVNATVHTKEPHVEVLTSEAKIIYDILTDYLELLAEQRKEKLSDKDNSGRSSAEEDS